MEELTLVLLIACLLSGGAVMLLRKLGAGAYVLSMTMSVLALGAIVSDGPLVEAGGTDLLLTLVGPFVIFLYSVWGMLFGFKESD